MVTTDWANNLSCISFLLLCKNSSKIYRRTTESILKLNGFLKQRKDRIEEDGTVEERKRINGEGQERVV